MCVRERERVRVCVCERESVCVCERERERESVCVCVRERGGGARHKGLPYCTGQVRHFKMTEGQVKIGVCLPYMQCMI